MADKSSRKIKATVRETAASETSPLLAGAALEAGVADAGGAILVNSNTSQSVAKDQPGFSILSVLLIGVFVSQADTCLVLATYGQIASEFRSLQNGTLIITSFILSTCAVQPLYGKLSDIFGRKRCLEASYLLFSIGSLGAGLSQSMVQIIIARAIGGCGGAGMVCMVSIIVTDLVPLNKVARFRSYVNLVQTTGRASGAALGGILAGAMGWRWPYIIECMLVMTGLLLVRLQLEIPDNHDASDATLASKMRRVDFTGSLFMIMAILGPMTILSIGGKTFPWSHPIILGIGAAGVCCAICFVLVEKYYAVEPIFPLPLLSHPVVLLSYSILFLQHLAISSMTFIVPMYFQILKRATVAEAGAYLVPSMVGNTIGGLLTGWWIEKTSRYKFPTIFGALSAVAAFASLMAVWRGNTSIWVSFLIAPIGFALGAAYSATFIGLTAGVDPADVAIAASGLYLSINIAMIGGVSLGTAVYQANLGPKLMEALSEFPDQKTMVRKALSDIGYVQRLDSAARSAILPVYIDNIQNVFYIGFLASILCFGLSLCQREKKIACI